MKRRRRSRGGRGERVGEGEGSHFSGSAPESQSRLLGKLFNLVRQSSHCPVYQAACAL